MLTIARKALLEKLEPAAKVAASKSQKDIPRWAKFTQQDGTLTITATDLEVGIKLRLPCEGPDCEFLVPASDTVNRLKLMTAECVTLDPQANGTALSGKRERFRLPAIDAGDFPSWSHDGDVIALQAERFNAACARVAFAMDAASTRYALSGVCLDVIDGKNFVVATDGRSLALDECGDNTLSGPPLWQGVLVPKFISACRTLTGDVSASLGTSTVEFSDADATVFGRLVAGRFPMYRGVLRHFQSTLKLRVLAGELLRITRLASLATSPDSAGVTLEVRDGTLRVGASSNHNGDLAADIDLPVASSGEASITLNAAWLAELLSAINPMDDLEWQIGPDACLFATGQWQSIIMGMGLKE